MASFSNNRLTVKPLSESDSLFSSITVEFTDSGLIEVFELLTKTRNREQGTEVPAHAVGFKYSIFLK